MNTQSASDLPNRQTAQTSRANSQHSTGSSPPAHAEERLDAVELQLLELLAPEQSCEESGDARVAERLSRLSPEALQRLQSVRACLNLVDQARPSPQGERPLPASAPLEAALLQLVAAEIRLRQRLGEPANVEEYIQRFPEYRSYLRGFLAQPTGGDALGQASVPCAGSVGASQRVAASDSAFPHLADYEIVRELGRGGMGVVYLARQVKLNRWVAVKTIRHGPLNEAATRARFRREAELIASWRHPNIVQIYDLLEYEEDSHLVLEYVEGISLAAQLRDATLAPFEAARLVETLARTMQAAHDAGIVHRDLKPANILLQGTGNSTPISVRGNEEAASTEHGLASRTVKVTDFGLARWLEGPGDTRTGDILGTPNYMAPEQARGEKGWSTPAVDIYALGAILYESVTGRPPFRAESTYETIRQVVQEEPVPPSRLQPRLPRDLETICVKCLEKLPMRRYARCSELAEDLRRFQAGEPIVARRTPPWRRIAKWARRRPASAALSATSAVAVLAILALWLRFTTHLRALNLDLKTQRDQASEMTSLAQEKQVEAERQKNRALASLQHAQQTASQAYHLAAQDPDLQAQALEPLRRRILQQSVTLQEELLDEFGSMTELAVDQAEGYRSLAVLSDQIQMPADALRFAREAVTRAEKAHETQPDHVKAHGTLGVCLITLADVSKRQGLTSEAVAAYQRSAQCFEQLVDGMATSPELLFLNLAIAHQHLGVLYYENKQLADCEKSLLAARKAMEEVLQRRTKPDVKHEDRLAGVINNLGWLYLKTDRVEAADQMLHQAHEIHQAILSQRPGDPYRLRDVAVSIRNLGVLSDKLERHTEAVDYFNQAIALYAQLAQAHPKVGEYRAYLARYCYGTLAEFHRDHGRLTEAFHAFILGADILQALSMEAPQEWTNTDYLGTILVQLAAIADAASAPDLLERVNRCIAATEPWRDRPERQNWARARLDELRQSQAALKSLSHPQ
jgi:serine/threonine protein kinase